MSTRQHKTAPSSVHIVPPVRKKRRWGWWLALGMAVLVAGVALSHRTLVAFGVRHWVVPRIAAKLGSTIEIDRIKATGRTLHLYNVRVSTPTSTPYPTPMRWEHIELTWNWQALWNAKRALATVVLRGGTLHLFRSSKGETNVQPWLQLLDKRTTAANPANPAVDGWPDSVVMERTAVVVEDESRGTVRFPHLEGHWRKGQPAVLVAHAVHMQPTQGPTLTAAQLTFDFAPQPRAPWVQRWPVVTVQGGAVTPWKSLSLSGIHGTLTPNSAQQAALHFAGGYGGVATDLWHADGTWDLSTQEGMLRLAGQTFRLSALDPVLKDSPLINRADTTLSGSLQIEHKQQRTQVQGDLHVAGLSVWLPELASQPIHHVTFDVALNARLDNKTHVVVHPATVRVGGVTATLTVDAERLLPSCTSAPCPAPTSWREKWKEVAFEITVPPTSCQAAFDAIPPALIPKLVGMKWKGRFSSTLRVRIELEKLMKTDPKQYKTLASLVHLEPKLGLERCKVTHAPAEVDAAQFKESFVHQVETEPNQFTPLLVGPDNPDFVPLAQISRYLIDAILTTEDTNFFTHHGFIVREYAMALARDILAGAFRYGASSMDMQLLKNLLLSKEKTLARKFSEALLTLYFDQAMIKDRKAEIYFNIIEMGPGLYGIGAAARHYFGKKAMDLTPREAVWFSSINPNPKERYIHYCNGAPSPKWEAYLDRILRRMHERGRLTDDELAQALQERLVFDRTDWGSQKSCMARRQRFLPVTPNGVSTGENPPEALP